MSPDKDDDRSAPIAPGIEWTNDEAASEPPGVNRNVVHIDARRADEAPAGKQPMRDVTGIEWEHAGSAARLNMAAPSGAGTEKAAALALAAAADGNTRMFEAKRAEVEFGWENGDRPPGVISLLIRALEANEPAVRGAAGSLAEVLGAAIIAAPLLAILERSRGPSAGVAARALANLGVKRAIPRLHVIGTDSTHIAACDALEALVRLGDTRGLSLLLSSLESSSADVRCSAAAALGRAGDRACSHSLVGLTLDPVPEVRSAAALALGDLKDATSTFTLHKMLNDSSAIVQVSAAAALLKLDKPDGAADTSGRG